MSETRPCPAKRMARVFLTCLCGIPVTSPVGEARPARDRRESEPGTVRRGGNVPVRAYHLQKRIAMRTSFRVLTPSVLLALVAASTLAAPRRATAVEFERVVIDDDFPGAYQVEVADVNGDRRPDVVAVGGGPCAWYQNPTWKKRVVTTPRQTPGIISSATADLDGDGKAEIAIAYEFSMNEPTRGEFALASQGQGSDDSWRLTPIEHVGSIPRLRWGDVDGDRRLDLIVAPI